MKKLLLITALAAFSLTAGAKTVTSLSADTGSTKHSSKFHRFKVDFTLGYAIPPTNSSSANANIKAGAEIVLEPHYRVSDAVAVGLRIAGAGLGYADTTGSGTGTSGKAHVSFIYSYCPTV
ncbi:MAG: hypothetical protein JSU01_11715, partial [Bacteroidetes bacterium]|nr:hypothetical protein [Bacteroidota bacterium]